MGSRSKLVRLKWWGLGGMKIDDLSALPIDAALDADLIIVGGGAAGITLAREFAKSSISILILESGGRTESPNSCALNAVENVGDPSSAAQIAKREEFHSPLAPYWSQNVQPFGVRCRGLGGSTQAWAGKSAPFDDLDFEARDWVGHSGWPIARSNLDPYVARAAERLNLGPAVNDEKFWDLLGAGKKLPLENGALRSYFWQFARSRIDAMDIMRFGPEFERENFPNIRVLINATVTQIFTDGAQKRFDSVEVAAPDGTRRKVRGDYAVLAASAIENPRLLMASRSQNREGLGNRSGQLGRYLMDHPGCRIAVFENPADIAVIQRYFGFYALSHRGGTHMYMHGLALSPDYQRRNAEANCALYMMDLRAPDDPWEAIKRLAKGTSDEAMADFAAVMKSPALLVSGAGRKFLQHPRVPDRLKKLAVDLAIKLNPKFTATEFQFGGLPHKLTAIAIDAITEQIPDPDNRVTLSERLDRFGVPLARIDWRIRDESKRTLATLAHVVRDEFQNANLPVPVLEPWIEEKRLDDAIIIDMAHTAGTTRMSADSADGVVDANCRLHDIDRLYVAGASVFPTSGHANPTLMICAMAIRLADHLKTRIRREQMTKAEAATDEAAKAEAAKRPLVLVTGANGRIGSVLIGALIDAGYRVRGHYSRAEGDDIRAEWRQADFRKSLDVDHLVEGCTAIIHLAGELSDVEHMERVNVDATRALAEAAQRHGLVYFGNASSMVVYGSPEKQKVTEQTPVIDLTKPVIKQYYADPDMREYARTKLLGEQALRASAPKMNLDIYRIAVVADTERFQESFGWGKGRKLFSLYRRTQYIHSKDLCDAIILLMKKGLQRAAPSVEVYNIVDQRAGTYVDLGKIANRRHPGRFKPTPNMPIMMDLAKAAAKYKATKLRYPIGMIKYHADKLFAAGFTPKIGFEKAVEMASDDFVRKHQ